MRERFTLLCLTCLTVDATAKQKRRFATYKCTQLHKRYLKYFGIQNEPVTHDWNLKFKHKNFQ